MFGKHLFQLAGGQAVAGHIDDIVGARHDVEIAVLVLVAGVARLVIAGEGGQIFLDEGGIRAPDARQAGRRQRQLDGNGAKFARGFRRAVLAQDVDLVSRHRHRRRPELHRQRLDPHRIGADRPSRLGLPPVINDRNAKLVLRPQNGVGVGPLAGKKQMPQARGVVPRKKFRVRVGPFDGAESGRRGEENLHFVFGNHPPEHPGIRGADGLSLEQDGGAAGDQRRIDDVGMADHPADVRGGPVHIARVRVVDVRHGPLQRHRVAAIVADHALRLAGGARGVENIERVCRLHRHRGQRFGPFMRRMPFQVTPGDKVRLQRFALIDNTG